MSYNSKHKGSEIEELLDSIGNKVDKVDGKQLSTEDFTTLLKQKLDGLSNYDDTEIQTAVSKLRTDLDTLVSGDTTTAIKTFNEVIAFLDGLEDTEDLASIIASIEQQIAAKQETLVSGTNIKTINGTSILGSGNVVIEGGAKVYTLNWDGESASVTLSQEEYDNIIEADIVVLNVGGIYHITVNKTDKEFSEAFGGYNLIGRLDFQEISAFVNISIEISTKLATFTIKEVQDIPTKTSQLENDSDFVSSDGLKTINGESIVGSGDIVIEGGGNEFYYWNLQDGVEDVGNLPVDFPSSEVQMIVLIPNGYMFLSRINSVLYGVIGSRLYEFDIDILMGTYTLTVSDIVNSNITSSSGAYAEVNHGTSDTTFTLTPNTLHVWDEVASLDLSFGDETAGVANEYLFQFTSDATATTLTLPSDIKWANDTPPTITENKIYQISVLKGLASVLEFSNAV